MSTGLTSQHFIVLGTGAWGVALATHLARQQHAVTMWGHHAPATDLAKAFAVRDDAIVLIAVPSFAFQETLDRIKPYVTAKTRIVWGTKGLSAQGAFLHELCEHTYPNLPLAVLSGPSFAAEVMQNLPTAVTIASNNPAFGNDLVQAFYSDVFRAYLSSDIIGVQLGGVVKNVLAIAVGMSDGLGFGANARAALITRGLAELSRLGAALGAQPITFMGLSGVGDMILTCTDNQSRNRRFGLALGEGLSVDEAQARVSKVIEGKDNAKKIMLLGAKMAIEMPICQQVYAVLYESLPASQAVKNLLTRTIPDSEF